MVVPGLFILRIVSVYFDSHNVVVMQRVHNYDILSRTD